MTIFLLIISLILFVMLVVVHEFGHFIAARKSGVEVEEFGIGFPPRAKILSKKNGTIYSLNWLPLGGFVKLKGEHDADMSEGSFGAAKTTQKVKIMLAGVGMNLVTAFLLFTILALIGIPKLIDNQFTVAKDTKVSTRRLVAGYVEPNSPASQAGLKVEQVIWAVSNDVGECVGCGSNGIYLGLEPKQLTDFTKSHPGQTVSIFVGNMNQRSPSKTLVTKLRSVAEVEKSKHTDSPKGYLGVAPTEFVLSRSTWSAPIVAVGLIKQFTVLTFKGIGSALANLFRGNTSAASAQVSGPVGIFVLLKDGSLLGFQFVLTIIAIISLTLAIMNVLPIPALDGGRLFVTLLFRAAKKPLKEKTEDLIHGTGFALLMVLFVLITIVDIKRNF